MCRPVSAPYRRRCVAVIGIPRASKKSNATKRLAYARWRGCGRVAPRFRTYSRRRGTVSIPRKKSFQMSGEDTARACEQHLLLFHTVRLWGECCNPNPSLYLKITAYVTVTSQERSTLSPLGMCKHDCVGQNIRFADCLWFSSVEVLRHPNGIN